MILLLKSMLIGLSIAAPVGAIGVLCIRRTLCFGRVSGLVSGMGAAFADATYGAIACFGIAAVMNHWVAYTDIISRIGGLYLCYLGISIFRTAAETSFDDILLQRSKAKDFLSTFFLTLSNPSTILSFTAIFIGLGAGALASTAASAWIMVIGVFLGSALWWLFLSEVIHRVRHHVGHKLGMVNKISGMIIMGFAIAVLFF